MKKLVRIRPADWLRDGRATLSRFKQWRLSPLSAILLAALSAIAAGTALFAVAALLWPANWNSGAAVPDWNPPTLAVVELDPPKPPEADTEALTRPIFAKTRKPGPKKAAPAAAAPTTMTDAPTDLVVTAIVKNKKIAQAFVTSSETPEGAWRKVGDTVGGWTLHKILHAEVEFQNGDQLARVKLYTPPPEPAPEEGMPVQNADPPPEPAPGQPPPEQPPAEQPADPPN